jgi:hypothetical protein
VTLKDALSHAAADAAHDHELLLRAERAEAEVVRLKKLINRDKTGLAAALSECQRAAAARWWIVEGRGSYEWDDDKYRRETGIALQEISEIASKALAASGRLADEAFHPHCATPNLDYARSVDARERAGHPTGNAIADDLRALGWTVAVHNDYRKDGEPFTFWLLTKDGRALKGEGRTDAEALDAVRRQLAIEDMVRLPPKGLAR